jgi:cytochrome d ubiquinol oxidase subunit I
MAVLFNPVAQAKFVHTVSAGYVTARSSCWRSAPITCCAAPCRIAKRSMTVAASFGLASALGRRARRRERLHRRREPEDEDRRHRGDVEHRAAPASFTVFGIPDQATAPPDYEVKVPWVLGLIATRSADKPVPGINELVEQSPRGAHQGTA